MKTVLHAGCGGQNKTTMSPVFQTPDWQEIRFDIDPEVKPAVVGDLRDQRGIADESVDAVWCSHVLEHFHFHEYGVVLREFHRILKPDGVCVILCPDLEVVCSAVTEAPHGLLQVLYQSAAGPIAAIDMLYGHRGFVAGGKPHMAHKMGFDRHILSRGLAAAGFVTNFIKRETQMFELRAVSYKKVVSEQVGREQFPNYAGVLL